MAYNYGLFPQPTGCAIVDLAIDTSSTDMNKNPGPKSLKQQIFSVLILYCKVIASILFRYCCIEKFGLIVIGNRAIVIRGW